MITDNFRRFYHSGSRQLFPQSFREIAHGIEIGFTGPMGIYMQDYGGPIGNRIMTVPADMPALPGAGVNTRFP